MLNPVCSALCPPRPGIRLEPSPRRPAKTNQTPSTAPGRHHLGAYRVAARQPRPHHVDHSRRYLPGLLLLASVLGHFVLIHLLRDASRHSDQRRVQWPSRALHDTDHTTLFTSRRAHRGRQSPALSASVVRHSSYDSGLKQRQETRVLAKTHDPSQEQPHSAHRLVPIEYLSIKEKREKGPARQKTARGTWQLPRPQWDNPQVTAPRQKK